MRNLKLAARMLLKTPFVTAIAVLSLALGIGANSAIYSLFDQMLLSDLPVPAPGELVNLEAPGPKPGSQNCSQAGPCEVVFSYPMSTTERRDRVNRALERVGMTHRTRHYLTQLSGGQQQRVAVARAVAGDPAILLADEPTGNLDSKNGEAVMELLRELNKNGSTICMVTHDSRYAQHADREVHLFDGRVVDVPALAGVA